MPKEIENIRMKPTYFGAAKGALALIKDQLANQGVKIPQDQLVDQLYKHNPVVKNFERQQIYEESTVPPSITHSFLKNGIGVDDLDLDDGWERVWGPLGMFVMRSHYHPLALGRIEAGTGKLKESLQGDFINTVNKAYNALSETVYYKYRYTDLMDEVSEKKLRADVVALNNIAKSEGTELTAADYQALTATHLARYMLDSAIGPEQLKDDFGAENPEAKYFTAAVDPRLAFILKHEMGYRFA